MAKLHWITKSLLFLTIVALGLAGGCSSSKEVSKTGGLKSKVYTIADPVGDWGFPSPYGQYQRGPGYIRTSFVFDTLIWKDENGFIPALAKTWEFVEEENAYLFQLHEEVKWHDGEKFTADDVKFTIEYCKEHPYIWVDTSKVNRVEILDDYKVKLYLSEAYAPFLNNFAGCLPILPEHIWSAVSEPEKFQSSEASIGTGPFKLVDYNKEQGSYLYAANEDYYLGVPKIDKLRLIKLNNEMAPAALKRGEVNFINLQPELKADVEVNGFETIKGKYDFNVKLMINHTKEPFNDKRFRQAIAYSIDREELVRTTKRGFALAGKMGILSPDSEWFNPNLDNFNFNPVKTRELLNELGYIYKNQEFSKNGKMLALELLVKPADIRDGEMIKQQLEKQGIKINLVSMEDKTIDNKVMKWDFDLALSGHGGLGSDPEILNKVILGKGFISARFNEDANLTKLLKEQLKTVDFEERKVKVDRVQKMYADNMPCITLYYPDWYWAHDGIINMISARNGIGFGIPLPQNKISFIR